MYFGKIFIRKKNHEAVAKYLFYPETTPLPRHRPNRNDVLFSAQNKELSRGRFPVMHLAHLKNGSARHAHADERRSRERFISSGVRP